MVFNYETRKDLIQQRESLLEEVEDLRLDILEYDEIIQLKEETTQFQEETIQHQKDIIILKAKRINALQQLVNSLLREKGAEPMFTEDDFDDEEIKF